MKQKMLIGVREIWEQMYEVEADTFDEACELLQINFMSNDEDGRIKILEDQFNYVELLRPFYNYTEEIEQ